MSSGKSRRQRNQSKLRKRLVKRKLFITNSPGLRTLRPSVRKRLAKERGPGLWILPENIASKVKDGGPYHHASLLGLPAELRQRVLLLSIDVRIMVARISLNVTRKEHRRKAAVRTLKERKTQLCQVSQTLRTDMQYVGKVWQEQLKGFLDRDNENKFPIAKTKERLSQKKRFAKCWYCNERHVRSFTECPQATETPQNWARDTRAVGGWRTRGQRRDSFRGTKTVFGD